MPVTHGVAGSSPVHTAKASTDKVEVFFVPFRKPSASTDNTTAALKIFIKAAASFRLSNIYQPFVAKLSKNFILRILFQFAPKEKDDFCFC